MLVNGPTEVYVERRGRVERADVALRDEEDLRDAIERILAPLGRRVDELSPMADARLRDGSRVNVVIPPLAVDSPVLSIRRFAGERPDLDRLVEIGTLTPELRELLVAAVRGSATASSICGGTGSGKTTLLNALSAFIDPAERVITIEDAAELRLRLPHVVRLESRPASVEGRGEVTIRDLLRNALRMRPDRIVIGEVRGGGGAGPAGRAEHRPLRGAVHRPRELARGRAAAARDAGADGGGRPPSRGDRRAGRARDRPGRSHGPRARRAHGWRSSAARVERVAGAVGVTSVWRRLAAASDR